MALAGGSEGLNFIALDDNGQCPGRRLASHSPLAPQEARRGPPFNFLENLSPAFSALFKIFYTVDSGDVISWCRNCGCTRPRDVGVLNDPALASRNSRLLVFFEI